MQDVDCALGKFRRWWRRLLICSNQRQFGATIHVSCICMTLVLLLKDFMEESMTFPIFCAQLRQEANTAGTASHSCSHLPPKRSRSQSLVRSCRRLRRGLLMQVLQNPNSLFNVPHFPSAEKVLAVEVQDVLSIYIYIYI